MRPLASDAHVQTDFSRGYDCLAECLRAADAAGLECVAITDRYHFREAEIDAHLEAIRAGARRTQARVIAAAELDIIALDGDVSLSSDAAGRFELIVASLGGHCHGVDLEPPARQSVFVDNLFACYAAAVRNPLVDVLGRPFNLGHFPASITPAELPRRELADLAALMFDREVGFELFAPIHQAYPELSVAQFTAEYAALLKVFRNAGVKFIAGSGARSAEAVGSTRYCQALMAAAGIELSQTVDLARLDPAEEPGG